MLYNTKLLALSAIFAVILSAADKRVLIEWDASNLRLSWKCLKDSKTKCSIDFLKRTMQAGKKQYPISRAETEQMAPALIRFLTEYAIASEDWFFEKGGKYEEHKLERGPEREIAKQKRSLLLRKGESNDISTGFVDVAIRRHVGHSCR